MTIEKSKFGAIIFCLLMSNKLILLGVLTLLIGGMFFVWKYYHTSNFQPESAIVQSKPSNNFESPLPLIREKIGAERFSKKLSYQGQLYTSVQNKFTVIIPPGTEVEERNEYGDYSISYFTLKDSAHKILITSFRGNVNASNLDAVIASGTAGYLPPDGFIGQNMLQCGDANSVCFLSQLFSQPSPENPEPQLMRLVEKVISKEEFPFYYEISMGAHYPKLTDTDLAVFEMIHNSFHPIR